MERKERRHDTREFKLEAVRLAASATTASVRPKAAGRVRPQSGRG